MTKAGLAAGTPQMRAWSFVLTFGTVSLLADFVYEGARSITGPLLASFGASALVVGAVTGAGEAAALILRLVSGPLADRTKRFWALTIAGYALTVITVPILGLAGALWVACLLVIAERVGKAVRSPAKDTMLSHATAVTGRGRGFAVHEAMDQVGAVIGPLTVAGMLAITGGKYGPSLLVLAIPGILVLALLVWLRSRVPNPLAYEVDDVRAPENRTSANQADDGATAGQAAAEPSASAPSESSPSEPTESPAATPRIPLPRAFWVYAVFTGMTMAGFATFGVISFHMVERHLLTPAAVPLIYAAAMAADAVAALATGWLYDRVGPRALIILPVLSALIPVFSFTLYVPLVVLGALLWGAATGVQESTLRATVADLVLPRRRATAYGIFAAILGGAALIGGTLAGALYQTSIGLLILVTALIQVAALIVLALARLNRKEVPTRGH
ncbi:MFS transporter [Paeniglutamicibacter antarcticus]|uniref:MFS transporter n=2 Tax=Arthrobacter terrae TaxID=2935737 RepID=A0A931CKQ2_9MICC|nr:MFS transporter [Arthrobacter terrae]